jgi:hypothetical protein
MVKFLFFEKNRTTNPFHHLAKAEPAMSEMWQN